LVKDPRDHGAENFRIETEIPSKNSQGKEKPQKKRKSKFSRGGGFDPKWVKKYAEMAENGANTFYLHDYK